MKQKTSLVDMENAGLLICGEFLRGKLDITDSKAGGVLYGSEESERAAA